MWGVIARAKGGDSTNKGGR